MTPRGLLMLLMLAWPTASLAIDIGALTFLIAPDKSFTSKQILNNNATARAYMISIIRIDRPGNKEARVRPAGGELMFTPRSLTLEAGRSDYVKFVYTGPQDDKERYYRVTFREIPIGVMMPEKNARGALLEPVIALEAILVVRPRQLRLRWDYSANEGKIANTGNGWFKLLVKNGCNGSDEQAETVYLRPGEVFRSPLLKSKNKKYIVTESRYIPLGSDCFGKAP